MPGADTPDGMTLPFPVEGVGHGSEVTPAQQRAKCSRVASAVVDLPRPRDRMSAGFTNLFMQVREAVSPTGE